MNRAHGNLLLSIVDAFFYSLMVGAGESYFCAFSLALGHSELFVGLLATYPLLLGGIMQLITPKIFNKFNNAQHPIVMACFIQAVVFLLISQFSQFAVSEWELFVVVSFYWFLAFIIGGMWNSWISYIVPQRMAPIFFARRNVFVYLGTFIGLLLSGIMLEKGRIGNEVLNLYSNLFLACGIFRLISTLILSFHRVDLKKIRFINLKKKGGGFSFKDFTTTENGKIFLFVIFFKMAVFTAAPFFTPYMLKQLNLNYNQFFILLSLAFMGKMIMMRMANTWQKYFSLEKIFFYSSVGISFMPLLWSLWDNFYYLAFLEILSGVMWGGFDLAFFLIVLTSIAPQARVKFFSFFNLLKTVAMAAGSSIGAFWLMKSHLTISDYHGLFVFSWAIRFLPLFFFPTIKLRYQLSQIVTRLLSVRPASGSLERPIFSLVKGHHHEKQKEEQLHEENFEENEGSLAKKAS